MSSGTSLADEKSEELAVSAAEAWLVLVDQEKYSESWDEAAQLFQGAITKTKWGEALRAVRAPLGKLVSRELKSKQYAESLPSAPDGKYVVLRYETSFEKKKSAIETVTPMEDPDGTWRVSGYFIK
jgi:hypothetical protein